MVALPIRLHESAPPQNIEAEEAVLGGCLLDSNAYGRIQHLLIPDCFYTQNHQLLWKAIDALGRKGQPTDAVTVTSYLADKKLLKRVGGPEMLAQICGRTVSAVNVDRYAELIREKFVRRHLMEMGHNIAASSSDTLNDIQRALQYAQQQIEQATLLCAPDSGQDPDEVKYNTLIERLKEILLKVPDAGLRHFKLKDLGKQFGWRVGELQQLFLNHMASREDEPLMSFEELKDKYGGDTQEWITHGIFPRGTTNLIYGTSGDGKTLLVYDLLYHALTGQAWNNFPQTNKPCRALVIQTDESPRSIIENLGSRLEGMGLEVKFKTRWSLESLLYLREEIEEYAPDLLIIDSLTSVNRFSTRSENDAEYARQIYALGQMSSELNCCTVMLHHANKSGDVRGSSSIRAAFDQILELKRPDDSRAWDDLRRLLSFCKSRLRAPATYTLELQPETKTWKVTGKKDDLNFNPQAGGGTSRESIVELLTRHRGRVFENKEIGELTAISPSTVRRLTGDLEREKAIQRIKLVNRPRHPWGYFVPDDRLPGGYELASDPQTVTPPHKEFSDRDLVTIAKRSGQRIGLYPSQSKENRVSDLAIALNDEKKLEVAKKNRRSRSLSCETTTNQDIQPDPLSDRQSDPSDRDRVQERDAIANCHTPESDRPQGPPLLPPLDSGGHILKPRVKVYYCGSDTKMKHLKGVLLTVKDIISQTQVSVTAKGWGMDLVRPSCEFSRAAKGAKT